ncbi:MAG TPA: hypothetical protein VFB07_07190 [Vicinamibacterales bacterium]|nr:hypothetical protein [Vicinamibacterales bacterium]
MIAVGLAIMIVSEAATLARIEPFYSWNTPICWTGFILFADAVVFASRGRSWIRSTPREFAWLALLSIPLWLVFEGYNQVLRNWYYVGLPQDWPLRMVGYAWSFATIWPAIFEGADLVGVVRGRGAAEVAGAAPSTRPAFSALSIVAGAAMLAVPFLVPADAARYLAAPVWLGFIFLLDPINARLGGPSLARDWNRTIDLLLSGLLCGVLWEFWNYWAGAKWHYTVPIMEHVKIFEMPLPGYLGFPPFALECFTMFTFVRLMFRHRAS